MAKIIKYEDENGVKYPTPVIEDSSDLMQKRIDSYNTSHAQKEKNLQSLGGLLKTTQKLYKKRKK